MQTIVIEKVDQVLRVLPPGVFNMLSGFGPECGAPLVAHRVVRTEGEEFLFAHALIRDGVYASLTRARRAELHRAAANWFGEHDLALGAPATDATSANWFTWSWVISNQSR